MSENAYPSLTPLRFAMLSVHTSPIASLGGNKTGGMNVYIKEVALEMGRRGIYVDIFTRASHPDELGEITQLNARVRVIYMQCGNTNGTYSPTDLFPFLKDFRQGIIHFAQQNAIQYDAIYSHYWLSGWVAIGLRQLWGTPFVQMFHTLGMMKTRISVDPNQRPTLGRGSIREQGEQQVIHAADRIIAATEAERSQLLLLYRADRRKIDIVPPGVDTNRFFPSDRYSARKAVNWAHSGCKHFLFVGRIERLKSVDTILQAINLIRHSHPHLQVCATIIGGDPSPENANEEMLHLQSIQADLKLQDRVYLVGAQSQDTLPDYYRAAEALIMSSDYESFGMVALEAMACGTPVIASEVGGLAYLVRDGETGFHFPVREAEALANRMIRVAEDEALRTQMGNAAATLAKHYQWSAIVERLLNVFTMLGTRPKVYRLPKKR